MTCLKTMAIISKWKYLLDVNLKQFMSLKHFLYWIPNEIGVRCNYKNDFIPALFEKAFALKYGSYSNLAVVSFIESVIGLINTPSGSIINNENPEECFEEISNNISWKAYILSTKAFRISDGIIGTHAYPILNVYIMNQKRVIKLYDLHKNCYNITNVIIQVNRNEGTFICDFDKLYSLIGFITVIPKPEGFKFYKPTISKSFNSYRELKNIIHSDCYYCCTINVYMMPKTLQKMNNCLNQWVIHFILIIVVMQNIIEDKENICETEAEIGNNQSYIICHIPHRLVDIKHDN